MLLLDLLLLLPLLLLLYVFNHVLIRGREATPYGYVVNTYSRSSSRISSSRSSSSSSIWIRPGGTSQKDLLITSNKEILINVWGYFQPLCRSFIQRNTDEMHETSNDQTKQINESSRSLVLILVLVFVLVSH